MRRWYSQFDTNRNGVLERDELRALLQHLHPDHAPDEKMLDWLIERATAIESFSLQLSGSLHGAVSRLAIMKTVEKYDAVIRQKTRLDEIFRTADVDGSGKLERSEVLAMMTTSPPRRPACVTSEQTRLTWNGCSNHATWTVSMRHTPRDAPWARLVGRGGGWGRGGLSTGPDVLQQRLPQPLSLLAHDRR